MNMQQSLVFCYPLLCFGKNKHVLLNGFRTTLDMRNFTIILAGNAPLENSLRNRVKELEFSGFDLQNRNNLAYRYFHNSLESYGIKLGDSFHETLDKIIRLDLDSNPGLRALQKTIDDFVAHIRQ